MLPVDESARPAAIITAPIATQNLMPMRSASQPIAMPPSPVPTQTRAPARATTDRSVPSESWIGFSPTTTSSGAPYEIDRIASVTLAARQEARLSMLAGRSGTIVSGIAGISSSGTGYRRQAGMDC